MNKRTSKSKVIIDIEDLKMSCRDACALAGELHESNKETNG